MRKIFIMGLCLFLLAAIMSSCNQDAQPNQASEPKAKEGKPKAKEAKPKAKGQDNKAKEGGLPQPKGGSERKNREIRPVSNKLLQMKYPNTVVLRGSFEDKRVALTFDDGPDRRFTPQVLDVLKKHDVKATFFLMGSRIKALPDVTRRIDQEGHSIGNHTYWHPKLFRESTDRMKWEVTETDDVLNQVVGFRPKLFRAPYGGLTEELVENMAEMDLTVVGWSVDSLDWMQLSAEEVQKNVLSNTQPGSIILMHSGGHWTQDLSGMVKALDQIIPKLKQDGIEFVTVSELLNIPERKQ